jgi:hypothetical protein
MTSPAFDHDLGLTQRIEDLPSSSSSGTRNIEEVRQQSCLAKAMGLEADTVAAFELSARNFEIRSTQRRFT